MPNETPDDLGPWPLEIIQKLAQVEHNTPMVYRLALEVLALRKDRDRLDWLLQSEGCDFGEFCDGFDTEISTSEQTATPARWRQALDAAMEVKP